ncbi:MAG TPA: tetratricopeptide repeat protein, partial [Cyclobacteriaceae bacterium]|nr:tetratricopeptide repeat protein [Cyclobacteriaceae bacterium]
MISSKGLLVLCLLILSTIVKGQTKISDSLEQQLKSATKEKKIDILNQLTYEFITNDNTKALTYNNQAQTLSRQLGYLKGEAIAFTYKGVYEYLTGQFPDAHKDLHKGLRLSIQAGDLSNQGYTLLQLGNCGLEEVENDSALFYFNGAYEIFKDSANPVVLSKIYRNMSAVYGQRYQYDKQQFYLDRSIAIRRLLPDKMLLMEGLALKANNALRSGDINGAEAIITEIEELVKNNPEFEETRNDLRHLKALIMFHRGKFEEASVLVDSARNYYFRVSLLRKYVTLLMDISKVFSDRGEYELALNNLYPALKLSKLRGFDSETYVIRNRIGWINFHLGDYTQALRLANEAINSKPKHQLKADLANALTLKGVSLSELNYFKEAKIPLDSALHISKRLKDSRGISEALLNLGALKTKQKEYSEAMTMYLESIEHAKASNYYYGLAWSTWGLGDIYFRNGDLKNATRYLDQSEQFAHQINANEILIMNFNTRRDLLA